jgi:hypothetical protein
MRRVLTGFVVLALAGLAFTGAGCSNANKKSADAQAKNGDGKKGLKVIAKHGGWWCQEHGVPEEMCSLCSDEAADKCKKEGDWCKEHDRAKSQCFKCDPTLYANFEQMYVAKYGSAPPRPPEEEFKK